MVGMNEFMGIESGSVRNAIVGGRIVARSLDFARDDGKVRVCRVRTAGAIRPVRNKQSLPLVFLLLTRGRLRGGCPSRDHQSG